MKRIKNVLRQVARPAVLAIAGLVLCAASSQAVDFTVYVMARGSTWAQVVPGSNTGGRVINGITDRVARNETVYVWCWATRSGEYAVNARPQYTCGSGSGTGAFCLPNWTSFVVSSNPNCDALNYCIQNNFGQTNCKKIPLGSR
jgi:hypothetical protein